MMSSIICLMGPTASGKTQLALSLAEKFPCEIISVDSALVYKGMDIGTAKPEKEILQKVPHHLIDIRDPSESYSAAQFREDALDAIKQIFAKNKTPVLVGGTMLYFKALQKGLSELPSANTEIRDAITQRANESGWDVLHQELQRVDPDAANRIHPHDTQRIQRALEVYQSTGKTITSWHNQAKTNLPFEIFNIAISPIDRSILHTRIEKRFHQMLEQGFLDEVKTLFNRGDLSKDLPAIRSVGYRQAWEYLEGSYSYEEMINKAIAATRQFAKRQLTWLRHWPSEVAWFDSEDVLLIDKVIKTIK